MMPAIGQRPQRTGSFGIWRIAAKQLSANAEQDPPAPLEALGLRFAPRKWLQQRQPCILELRQSLAGHPSPQKLVRDHLKPRLGRHVLARIQFLEPLAPPREADRAKV